MEIKLLLASINSQQIVTIMYQSIPSLTIPPPRANPWGIFLKGESPPLGHKESAKPRSLGQKNRAKTPGAIIFKYPAKKTMNETEIMENSTKMLIYLNHLKAQSFLVAFMDIQNISNHFPFIYKPAHEIHGKQVPKYDFNK